MFGIGIGKYIAIGAGYLVLIVALMFQTQRIKTKDAQLATLLQQVTQCIEVNQNNERMVADLRAAEIKIVKGYEERLKIKDKTLAEIDRIYKLEAPKEDSNDTKDNTSDPIVGMLDQLWVDKTLADAGASGEVPSSGDTGKTELPPGQPMGCH